MLDSRFSGLLAGDDPSAHALERGPEVPDLVPSTGDEWRVLPLLHAPSRRHKRAERFRDPIASQFHRDGQPDQDGHDTHEVHHESHDGDRGNLFGQVLVGLDHQRIERGRLGANLVELPLPGLLPDR